MTRNRIDVGGRDKPMKANYRESKESSVTSAIQPFDFQHAESPEQYIQRTYLEFLWLPEVRYAFL